MKFLKWGIYGFVIAAAMIVFGEVSAGASLGFAIADAGAGHCLVIAEILAVVYFLIAGLRKLSGEEQKRATSLMKVLALLPIGAVAVWVLNVVMYFQVGPNGSRARYSETAAEVGPFMVILVALYLLILGVHWAARKVAARQ